MGKVADSPAYQAMCRRTGRAVGIKAANETISDMVATATDEEARWLSAAHKVIDDMPRGARFIIDDVTDIVGPSPNPNLTGAVTRIPAAQKKIKKTGREIESSRKKRKGGSVKIWVKL